MKITFLMIARIIYEKGYSQYVAAAKRLKEENPNLEFQLLGSVDKSYPNHVPISVVEDDVAKGYIKYLGFKEDILPVLSLADCVVLPSFYNEGLSRVLMEAMALAKPIITTDIPGCRETVEEGINGYLVKPKDEEDLMRAIRTFVSLSKNERLRMGKLGRLKAERDFDIEKVIEEYHKITDRLLVEK